MIPGNGTARDGAFSCREAEILAVGTELLLGQIVNSNAAFLARQLSELGINHHWQQVVGDHPSRLKSAAELALSRCDLLLLCGGLGPTEDDISLAAMAELSALDLEERPRIRKKIERWFTDRGRVCPPNNFKQALLPTGATEIINNNGTAPGSFWFIERDGKPKMLVLLPGPPSELQPMFLEELRPVLAKYSVAQLEHHYFHVVGMGESLLEETLRDLISGKSNPSLATYASEGEVLLRLSSRRQDGEEEVDSEAIKTEIRRRLGDLIYEEGERNLPQVLSALLRERGLKIAFAESCTAGLATAGLAREAGASDILAGAAVVYSQEMKERLLGVDRKILENFGAVSRECALEMAENLRAKGVADLCLAITGIAGPGGGTEEKPVGTVFMALAADSFSYARHFYFSGNRQRIQSLSVRSAYELARRFLLGLPLETPPR